MDYMFTFFEWHTQQGACHYSSTIYCLWTICLLFLNDIHNGSAMKTGKTTIVYGLYVYFFWMTYTTLVMEIKSYKWLFMDYMFTFFEWHTQPVTCSRQSSVYCLWTICLLFLNDIHNTSCFVFNVRVIVYGLYVYFFWMTYTTSHRVTIKRRKLFMDYMFTFFEWHTQRRVRVNEATINCLWTICLLFLNDIHNRLWNKMHQPAIVYGLYVYFFWMTYTTRTKM